MNMLVLVRRSLSIANWNAILIGLSNRTNIGAKIKNRLRQFHENKYYSNDSHGIAKLPFMSHVLLQTHAYAHTHRARENKTYIENGFCCKCLLNVRCINVYKNWRACRVCFHVRACHGQEGRWPNEEEILKCEMTWSEHAGKFAQPTFKWNQLLESNIRNSESIGCFLLCALKESSIA